MARQLGRAPAGCARSTARRGRRRRALVGVSCARAPPSCTPCSSRRRRRSASCRRTRSRCRRCRPGARAEPCRPSPRAGRSRPRAAAGSSPGATPDGSRWFEKRIRAVTPATARARERVMDRRGQRALGRRGAGRPAGERDARRTRGEHDQRTGDGDAGGGCSAQDVHGALLLSASAVSPSTA